MEEVRRLTKSVKTSILLPMQSNGFLLIYFSQRSTKASVCSDVGASERLDID